MVIRFPFILTSSYPHEILHNWWGNSVFVDYPTGNWCEGLTAYMADHLMKEQAGQAAEYRRDTLKKYRDFVRDGRDFPLTEFRSRHSAATEAVGYGKTLMGFHMLRRQLGDEAFTGGAGALLPRAPRQQGRLWRYPGAIGTGFRPGPQAVLRTMGGTPRCGRPASRRGRGPDHGRRF